MPYKVKANYLLMILLSSFFLVSCSANNNEQIEEDLNLSAESQETQGDSSADTNAIIRIAMNTEPDSLNPYLSAASDTKAVMMNVFEGLVGINEKGDIIPRIAESWEISSDGLVYEFTIRDHVYFHNGQLLTVNDVLYSLNRLSGLDGAAAASSSFESVVTVEQTAENKVAVTIAENDASFLSLCMAEILPAGYEGHDLNPIGTGPYKFKSYQPGQSLILELNQDYYDPENGGVIPQAEFVFMPDENAKILALRSGAIHMFSAAGEIIDQISDEGFTKHHNFSNAVQLLALNNIVEPFNDIRVREALNYGINREEISMFITNGTGYPIYTTLTPGTSWYNADTESVFPYNPEKARQLLSEAGYENGFHMEITVPSNYLMHVNTAQVIVNQLETIGISAEIKLVEWGQWLSEVHTERNYQSTVVGLTGKVDPHEVMNRFHSDFNRNFYNYFNDEYDALVEAGLKATDIMARAEIYNEAQMILTKDSASIFLQDPGSDVIFTENLKGYKSYPISFWDLSSLYFE